MSFLLLFPGSAPVTKETSMGLYIFNNFVYGPIDCVMTYEVSGPVYNDQTTAANNATINDVQLMFDSVGDILYYGNDVTFIGVKTKYSTKGVIGSAAISMEYSKGSGVWGSLSCSDGSNKFTEDPGTYVLTFTPPGDWATDTVDGKTHYWIRYRLTASSYDTNPQLDQIWARTYTTKETSMGLRIVNKVTKETSMGLRIFSQPTKEISMGLTVKGAITKETSMGLRIVNKITKETSMGLRIVNKVTKETSMGLCIPLQPTKETSMGLAIFGTVTKETSMGLHIQAPQAKKGGDYYAKIGSTIFTNLKKDSFRITEELNKIPSFEFEIANTADNRAAITAGITDILRIYHRLGGTDTLLFTGIINGDAIEYLSLERIRLVGYASYIDLNWRFHQHLNSEDAEAVGKCFVYSGSYTDYTTAANNDTINDVTITFSSVNDAIYIGQNETFFGAQVKYSTKGVQAASTTVVWEYSEGSGVWSTMDVLDETRAFTQDVGTYYVTIPHKPSDWAKETVNSVKKFWIRARLSDGSYTIQPKLDRIKITNVDVYRVYYFDTAANTIMDEVLDGTGYSMDVTDACPSDTISIVAEYETKLRLIAGVANALTWDDSGDKKAYQWWIDTSKKVHFKQKRGDTLGDITAELTILNNVEDYFNLSNRLHFLGNYDGRFQLRSIIENLSSQDTHEIRELAVPEERYNNYIPLKEAAQKAMSFTKAPLQKIAATVTTKYWIDNGFEVGDTVTLHQSRWNLSETAFQIVRADIGPRVTNVDMGISQEHLDGLKADLQRQMDITGVRMHGSTSLLQFGPETMNYQRVDATTVYPAKLKIEIPSDVRYIHKVLLSWTIGPYHADVTGGNESEGHDHTGFTGSSSAHEHTGYTGAAGEHTPTELSKAHVHKTEATITIQHASGIIYAVVNDYVQGTNHRHSGGATGYSNDNAYAIDELFGGTACDDGWCINNSEGGYFATSSHYHQNSDTGYTAPSMYIETLPKSYVKAINPTAFAEFSLTEDPAHVHTINYVGDHNDHLVETEAGETLTVITEAAGDVDLTFGIHEEAAGTTLELLVNSEVVASDYIGNQTDIRIDGYLSTGNNTVEIRPIVGENGKKGSCTIVSSAVLFIEAKK